MLDDATKTARIFPGTTSSAGGSKTYDSMNANKYANLTLGGGGSGASQFWTGTINYFRYYDRILSDAELAQNREVDQARFFGELSETNVLVRTKYANVGEYDEVLSEAVGAYKVEGSWTFSATKVVDHNGVLRDVVGYYTEDLVNGKWANKTWHLGTTYSYEEGTAPVTVRLTWRSSLPGTTFIFR